MVLWYSKYLDIQVQNMEMFAFKIIHISVVKSMFPHQWSRYLEWVLSPFLCWLRACHKSLGMLHSKLGSRPFPPFSSAVLPGEQIYPRVKVGDFFPSKQNLVTEQKKAMVNRKLDNGFTRFYKTVYHQNCNYFDFVNGILYLCLSILWCY